MKKSTRIFTSVIFGIALLCSALFLNSCEKEENESGGEYIETSAELAITTIAEQNKSITQVLSVANIYALSDGITYKIMFNKNEQVFDLTDVTMLAQLQKVFRANEKIKVTFNPWQAKIEKINALTNKESALYTSKQIPIKSGLAIDLKTISSKDLLDNPAKLGVINTTSPGTGLTNVVPDMATAQLMFNYLTKQCCAISGPYGVDYCISFQYADDGCYARAHKMCDVLNNKYHYATHKIFSFANTGGDVLSVQAQKWGGCCVNWWYHVAPLVSVKTPTGVKAFVFDPAMFDQPVLLSVWLHAQQNPVCASWGTANVSMINVQPTSSYAPADYSGYAFYPDPAYTDTNATLVAYSNLLTCP